jgi:hypothetical protein
MRDDIKLGEDEGCLCVLDGKGDTTIRWNQKKSDEVEVARKIFNDLVKEKKYAAFSIGRFGRKNEQIKEFDPMLGKLIIIPPMAGG